MYARTTIGSLRALALAAALAAPGCMLDAPASGNGDGGAVSKGLGQDEPVACMTHGDCPSDMRCGFVAGSCGDASGTCLPTVREGSADCMIGAICGCDGVTYASDCEAWAEGVSVWFAGSCDASTQPDPDPDPEPEPDPDPEPVACGGQICSEGEFCFSEDGTCSASSGSCRSSSAVCTGPIQPMCGCDGTSYGSFCAAVAAGASIAHPGPC
jgi:hypothetical protein